MTQLRPMDQDYGYTVERCKTAINACTSLTTIPTQRKHWERVAKWWEAQLKFAENRK